MPTEPLKDQIALVTGAGRGIGAATARLLAQRGARVVITSRTQSELAEVASSIPKDRVLAAVGDITDENFVVDLFRMINARFGPLSILVNNAGAFDGEPISELTRQALDRVIAVNLRAPFLCCREAFKQMSAATGGVIVNVSSLGGLRGTEKFPGFSAYSATKFAIVGMTECLALEGREFGIRVNCVAPGAVNTQMLKKAAPQVKTDGKPEDIARSIAFLCDPVESGAITGSVLEIITNME